MRNGWLTTSRSCAAHAITERGEQFQLDYDSRHGPLDFYMVPTASLIGTFDGAVLRPYTTLTIDSARLDLRDLRRARRNAMALLPRTTEARIVWADQPPG